MSDETHYGKVPTEGRIPEEKRVDTKKEAPSS